MEICYDGVWGSVCDNNWNNWNAAIVCLQLGFQGTSMQHYSFNNILFNIIMVLTL